MMQPNGLIAAPNESSEYYAEWQDGALAPSFNWIGDRVKILEGLANSPF